MLIPFSDIPAYRARLARIGGVDVYHGESCGFGLVGDKNLQLPESPSVQSCAHPLSRLDAVADMRQVFHAYLPHVQPLRFPNDALGYFVVDVFDMPPLTPGESAQLTPGCAAPIGLKTATIGKVLVAAMPQFSAAEDLATARGGEIVLPGINVHHTAFGDRGNVGDVQHEIEKPPSFAAEQFTFLGLPGSQQVGLMLAANKRHGFAPLQGEQGNFAFAQGVGAMVEMDRATPKGNLGHGLVIRNALVGLERFVGISDALNGVTDHLTAKRREPLPNRVIGQMVQGDTVPAAMLPRNWDYRRACLRKGSGQRRQFRSLHSGWQKFQGYGTLHIIYDTPTKVALQT